MKSKIYAAVLLFSISTAAQADFFQIVDPRQGFLVAVSPVLSSGQLLGYTDQYGRIAIHNLSPAPYYATVIYYGQPRTIVLPIDGNKSILKLIYLQ